MRFTLLSSAAFCGLFLSVAAVPLTVPRGNPAGGPEDLNAHGGAIHDGAGHPGVPVPGVIGHDENGVPTTGNIPTGVGKDGHPCGGRDDQGLVGGLLGKVNTVACEGLPETLQQTGDTVKGIVGGL